VNSASTAPVIDCDSVAVAQETTSSRQLLSVRQAAILLGVSDSWVRRHKHELPLVPLGGCVRFNLALLQAHMSCNMPSGKSLRPERRRQMPSRYQCGSVYQKGRKKKVWYGVYREDVVTPTGIKRRQRKVRLGTVAECPTKNAARKRLSDIVGASVSAPAEMTFRELTDRWQAAEGPTMKAATLGHYTNALRIYVLPTFGCRNMADVNREDIQMFLAEKAKTYSRSTLRSMRVVLGITLGWAADCGWLPKNPCNRVKLPQETGGRRVVRTVLSPGQIIALAGKLKEPYATFVLFVAATGLRISEAIAVRWSDFDGNVLHVTRRIYNGDVDTVKSLRSVRNLPLAGGLVGRMKMLSAGDEIFRSRAGSPLNPGNALLRYVRPAAKELGIELGGWHDLRHTLTTTMRRNGVHPKVVSDILGHSKVNLAMDVYDRSDVEDFNAPLGDIAKRLLPDVTQSVATA